MASWFRLKAGSWRCWNSFYAIQAAIAFSMMGALIKAASAGMPNEMIVFTRCFIGLVILTPWALSIGLRQALATRRWGGHLLRAGFGIVAMYCFFYALGTLPLAKAMLLTYSMPLFLPFVAWAWLRERPTPAVWLAVSLGFVGIALMVDPRGLGGGTLTGTLSGSSGTDFDLYLQKLSSGSWVTVASSEGSASSEPSSSITADSRSSTSTIPVSGARTEAASSAPIPAIAKVPASRW